MPFQGEGGGLPVGHGMAFFTLVQIRGPGELAIVVIFMAIRALGEFNLVDSCSAFIDVALGALHGEVLSLQRIVGGVVIFCQERRWLERIHRMAGLALDAFRPLGKLPVVRIGQVTVCALGEGNFLLEIAALVTRPAVHRGVLAE